MLYFLTDYIDKYDECIHFGLFEGPDGLTKNDFQQMYNQFVEEYNKWRHAKGTFFDTKEAYTKIAQQKGLKPAPYTDITLMGNDR